MTQIPKNEIPSDPNWLLAIATIGLAIATIVLVFINFHYLRKSNKNTEEQLKLTRHEIQSRLRPELLIEVYNWNTGIFKNDKQEYEGKLVFHLKNVGTMPARNVKVHFQDSTSGFIRLEQLVKDRSKIFENPYRVKGIIRKNGASEMISHSTSLPKFGHYQIAVWVTYDYADVKNDEFIQIIDVIDGPGSSITYMLSIIYDKNDIQEEMKRSSNASF
jgi:hypothetical protein